MILVRDVFRLRFGKAKEAKALWKEGRALRAKAGYGPGRAFMDLIGPYYTFVMETEYESLAAYEKALKDILGSREFGGWYQKFVPRVESGTREVFTAIE